MRGTLLERRWFRLFVVLLVAALCLLYFANRPKFPGSLGKMVAQLDVGMSYRDARAVMLGSYSQRDHPRTCLHGRTRDGREITEWLESTAEHNLTSVDEIDSAQIHIYDDDDTLALFVTIERGVVTKLRLESDSIWEELRFTLAAGTGWGGCRSLTRDRGACFEFIARKFFNSDW